MPPEAGAGFEHGWGRIAGEGAGKIGRGKGPPAALLGLCWLCWSPVFLSL